MLDLIISFDQNPYLVLLLQLRITVVYPFFLVIHDEICTPRIFPIPNLTLRPVPSQNQRVRELFETLI